MIGREGAVAALRRVVDTAASSHGGLMLVTGEAGIGKTTLVADAAAYARDVGALVLSGMTLGEEAAPGYWPWTQIVRGLRRCPEWTEARADAGSAVDSLLGAGPRTPSLSGLPDLPDTAEFELHDAVTTLLVAAARHRPIVVVLDDLHWSDPESVKLLEFVARHTWFERILLIGTYRDGEVDSAEHPLHERLTRLAGKATMLTLTGLDVVGIRELITRTTGTSPDEDLAAEVHRRTGGNPFYAEQTIRLHDAGGRHDAVAPGVAAAINARLAQLPDEVTELLIAAAVLGDRFDLRLLAAVSSTTAADLRPVLDTAVTARLIVADGEDRYAFVHALVREVLYAAIDDEDRGKRHADVVRCLEAGIGQPARPLPWELAHHAYRAVAVIGPDAARAHLRNAIGDACGRLAPDEVSQHARRAAELVPHDRPLERATIRMQLADTLHCAGELTESRTIYGDVLADARQLGDAQLLANAALGIHELGSGGAADVGREEIATLDEAHHALTDSGVSADDPLAVRVLAAASRARLHVAADESDVAQARDLADRALTLARSSGDQMALGAALIARHDAAWAPGTGAERLTLADEMRAVGRRNADEELQLRGSLLRMVALLEHGDPRAFDEHKAFTALVDGVDTARWRMTQRSRHGTLATLTGRFDDAGTAIDEAKVLGERIGEAGTDELWVEQRWVLAMLRGESELATEFGHRMDAFDASIEPFVSAVAAAQFGARASVDDVRAAADLVQTHPPMFAPLFLRGQAQLAAATRDAVVCAEVRKALLPLRNLWAVVAGGGAVHGPYAYWIAQLDLAVGELDDAVDGFTAAVSAADRLGARPWSVEARYSLAQALHARDAAGDAQRAAELAVEVHSEATELQMSWTAQQAGALTDTLRAAPGAATEVQNQAEPSPVDPTAEPGTNEFRFDGSVWVLRYAGHSAHLPDAKGLRDLHVLLSRPGIEVPAAELVDAATGAEAATSADRLGADAVLDERAKAEYRRRLLQLDEEIDGAAGRHDDRRAAQLDAERAALLDELRSATGLHGRARRLGDEGERARKTVTARIRDALRRMDKHHPDLAEHLRAGVTTGITCAYQPAREVRWTLQISQRETASRA